MTFKLIHTNFNVVDVKRSAAFYAQALGLEETHRKEKEGFVLVYLADAPGGVELELTQLYDHPAPYELGENETHIAFAVDDFDAAYALHQQMGCICYENKEMGLYFIEDPDGYWIEILPAER